MKEGFWIQTATGKNWQVDEHATFAKSPAGAEAMGLPEKVRKEIEPLTLDFNGPDRAAICIAVMKAGYIRARGHGVPISFEFWGHTQESLWAILAFAQNWAGPFSWIIINNLRTNEQYESNFEQFQQRMKNDTDEVLRIAKQLVKNPAQTDEHPDLGGN